MRGTEKRAHGHKGEREGNKRERRPRKQVSWRTRRPTAGRRPRSLTQILQTTKHHPSSARFTISSSSIARRSSSSWLSSHPSITNLLLLPSAQEAPRRLEDSDKRGRLTRIFGMHGAEDDASWRRERERERGRRRTRGTQKGI